MEINHLPRVFEQLLSDGFITMSDIENTEDGFWMVCKSLSDILAVRKIYDFPVSDGTRLLCEKFYDDWFLYAVPGGDDHTYSLVKMREQEYDSRDPIPADGDTPGVTISFIAFVCEILTDCLADPNDDHRKKLDCEINRVVAYQGERHHKELKRYFVNPKSEGAYLVADVYTKHIASLAGNETVTVSEYYKELVRKRSARLPHFIESLNRSAGHVVCDHEKIYIQNKNALTEYERAAILATHTGNTSVYSFAAEVEFHARFLIDLAKMKLPFFGKSIYDSAVRADMIIDDKEFTLSAPFYKENARIVKRQYALHGKNKCNQGE